LCIGKKKTEAETKEKICSYCHKKRKEKEEEQEEKSLKVELESRAGQSLIALIWGKYFGRVS